MDFAHGRQRVPLPSIEYVDAVKAHIVACLQAHEDVQSESIRWIDGTTLTATTEPSLRSWGETITITIEETELVVHVESPDQFIDWLKSTQTARSIAQSLTQSISDVSQSSTNPQTH